MKVYGTVDENGEDETVYDHVILAADLAPVQSIFKNTYDSYKSHPNILSSLDICNNNYFNNHKIINKQIKFNIKNFNNNNKFNRHKIVSIIININIKIKNYKHFNSLYYRNKHLVYKINIKKLLFNHKFNL